MFSSRFAQKHETVDVQPKCLSFAKLMAKKLIKKFSWIMSLTKRYIFLKVNLNVYTVVIKFYRNYVTNSLSFL